MIIRYLDPSGNKESKSNAKPSEALRELLHIELGLRLSGKGLRV